MADAVRQDGNLKNLIGQEVVFTRAQFKRRRGGPPQLIMNVEPHIPTGGMILKPLDKLYVRIDPKAGIVGVYSTHDKANKDAPEGTLTTWARFME